MLIKISKNKYVRATIIVAVLTAIAGLLQANISGPLFLIFISGLYLGSFLTLLLLVLSIFSLIKSTKSHISEMNRIPQEKNESETYKKRFMWCLIISLPGYVIWISAAFTTKDGGGEAYILFIPLFFLSAILTFSMILYGIAFLYKRNK